MRGVRFVAERVEEKNVEVLQQSLRRRGNLAEVCQVGGAADTESADLRIAVHHGDWHKLCSEQLQRSLELVQFDLGQSTEFVIAGKDVLEHATYYYCRRRLCIERNLSMGSEGQRAQIAEAEDVVGMGVGIPHSLQMLDAFSDRLLPEIRTGIDQHATTVIVHQHRRPRATVMRVRRS